MGLFLAMSSVVGIQQSAVEAALSKYASERGGAFEAASGEIDPDETAGMADGPSGATVVHPNGFSEWDEASEWLSRELDATVFSIHIHDGDFWMFILYERGEVVSKFNPLPGYWEELPPDEHAAWLPDPQEIATRVPGVSADRLAPYLREWSAEGMDGKAQPEDEFGYIDWQVTDFMRELGFRYLEPGEGTTYRFRV